MNSRLKEIRKFLDLTQAEFAAKIKLAQNSYSQIETGQAKLTEKNIEMVCRVFNVNEYWLRTGKGEMFNDPLAVEDDQEEEILALFRRLPAELKTFVLRKIKELLALEEEKWGETGEKEEKSG
jgi:transcriptional regulator with XRE-family HTH domain